MKYRISVTRFHKKIMSPLSHFSGSLTNEILVPNCLKAQYQQNLHYQCIQSYKESNYISYSRSLRVMVKLTG